MNVVRYLKRWLTFHIPQYCCRLTPTLALTESIWPSTIRQFSHSVPVQSVLRLGTIQHRISSKANHLCIFRRSCYTRTLFVQHYQDHCCRHRQLSQRMQMDYQTHERLFQAMIPCLWHKYAMMSCHNSTDEYEVETPGD